MSSDRTRTGPRGTPQSDSRTHWSMCGFPGLGAPAGKRYCPKSALRWEGLQPTSGRNNEMRPQALLRDQSGKGPGLSKSAANPVLRRSWRTASAHTRSNGNKTSPIRGTRIVFPKARSASATGSPRRLEGTIPDKRAFSETRNSRPCVPKMCWVLGAGSNHKFLFEVRNLCVLS